MSHWWWFFGGDEEAAFTVHARGRRPIGVSQQPGQGGWNYPLLQPSADVEKLLADAWLAYEDNTNRFALPFRVKWLYGFGANTVTVPVLPTHVHDVEIVDSNGLTVFDSTAATTYNSWDWDGRLRIVEWQSAGDILRLVYHYAWSPEDTPVEYDEYIEPQSAELDARAVWQYPRRVTSLRVGLTTLTDPEINWQNGYNTDLRVGTTDTTDGARRSTTVVFNAAPNSGSVGRFGPGCDEQVSPAIRRINGIGPQPRGEFALDATGCYRVQRPVLGVLNPGAVRDIRVQNHALQVSNDCGPCCECDDFIAVWEAIRRLRDRYATLISQAKTVRDTYHNNRQRWIDSQQCRSDDRLRLVVSPVCPDELGVAVGYCNNSDECLENLIIPISFQYEDKTPQPCSRKDVTCEDGPGSGDPITAVTTVPGEIACQSTFRQGNTNPDAKKGCGGGAAPGQREFYNLGGKWPHYWAQWDKVEPGGMAAVTFRLAFDNAESADAVEVVADAFAVGGVLTISNGSPIPGYIPGEGPVSTPASMHLVACPKFVSTGLNQEPCCESSAPGSG